MCPACGSPTSFEFVRVPPKKSRTSAKIPDKDPSLQIINVDDGESFGEDSGQVLRCSGPQLLCQPRAINALAYAYSRQGLDVKGLSKSKLKQLFEEGIIRFPSDLFTFFGVEDEGGEGNLSTPLFDACHCGIFCLRHFHCLRCCFDWQCSIE